MKQQTMCESYSAQHSRQRKPSRDLQWRIPFSGGEPVWSEGSELRAALVRLLDSNDNRIAASRFVLGWQMLPAAGVEDATLADAADVVQAKSLPPVIQRLVTVASELKAQAKLVAEETSNPEISARCAELVVHTQRDVSRIRNQLLWAVDGNLIRMEG